MQKRDRITVAASVLSVAGLFIEQSRPILALAYALHLLDLSVFILLLWETIVELREAPYRVKYVKENWPSLAFFAVFSCLFVFTKYMALFSRSVTPVDSLPTILRNIFLVIKVSTRLRKAFKLMDRLASHPAQTLLVSFLLVILAGTLALMMPFSCADGAGLVFLDALFTSTAAVCVTGLMVIDTATRLSRAGQAVLFLLMQIGGLGIMAFSFFAMFALRRKISLRDRLTVSYMLREDDMTGLAASLKTIVLSTLAMETLGALLLFPRFFPRQPFGTAVFFSFFHAVSAFCNAGYSLYPNSLESFRQDWALTAIIALLVICGSIGFSVLRDLRHWARACLVRLFRPSLPTPRIRSLNTRVVLILSFVLFFSAGAGFYLLEHRGVMADYSLGEQYLAAFFQSAVLRSAGFNSVPMASLKDGTLLFMMFFMFIGGASGSTAGGIKVNSLAAIWAYLGSFLRQENTARIGQASISSEKVGRSFLIMLFGLIAIFAGSFLLSLTESKPFVHLLFEAVSAFATVGLSVGISPSLSAAGKGVIILLMFLGRLGPLTILSAASRHPSRGQVEYPAGDLAIG